MDRNEIFETLRTELGGVLDVDPAEIVLDAHLGDTLEADSVDLIEVAGVLEQRWGITLEDLELHDLQTVADFVDLLATKVG